MPERKNPTKKELEKTKKELQKLISCTYVPTLVDRDHGLCQPGPDGCIHDPPETPELPRTGILSRAEKIVDERMEKYGVPTESWTRIGRMWGAYLGIDDIPAEVCLQMMTMVKKIRERYEHHPDNWVDDAGYVDCAHRVLMEKLSKKNP